MNLNIIKRSLKSSIYDLELSIKYYEGARTISKKTKDKQIENCNKEIEEYRKELEGI